MKLKQQGKTNVNGLNYFDLCSDNYKYQFGYIKKEYYSWKLYININGQKNYYYGSLAQCIKRAEELRNEEF